MMKNRIFRLDEYALGANPDELELDEKLLDALVELVGSEEQVEAAAEAAYNDLLASFEKNELEIAEGDMPEKLAVAALIVKLVEMGHLGPDEADSVIAEYLD